MLLKSKTWKRIGLGAVTLVSAAVLAGCGGSSSSSSSSSDEINWYTPTEISTLDISKVTVRKYMHYLTKNSEVIEQINYDTGGRPCMVYFMK